MTPPTTPCVLRESVREAAETRQKRLQRPNKINKFNGEFSHPPSTSDKQPTHTLLPAVGPAIQRGIRTQDSTGNPHRLEVDFRNMSSVSLRLIRAQPLSPRKLHLIVVWKKKHLRPDSWTSRMQPPWGADWVPAPATECPASPPTAEGAGGSGRSYAPSCCFVLLISTDAAGV